VPGFVLVATALGSACSLQTSGGDEPVGAVQQGVTGKGFPTNTSGAAPCASCMKVTSVSQSTMNSDVEAAYNKWKSAIVKTFSSGTLAGKYYIAGGANGAVNGYTAISSSEAHGYGMVIFPLMAGYDANAKTIFDSLDYVRKSLPSSTDSRLMNWALPSNGNTNVTKNSAATDGDMDMAYGLLLAYDQWGDAAYLSEAKSIIAGMEARFVDTGSGSYFPRLNVGDPNYTSSAPKQVWNGKTYYEGSGSCTSNASPGTSAPYLTRPSDYMIDHMRVFKVADGNSIWSGLETGSLNILTYVRNGTTGLVPDFVVNSTPRASCTGTGDEDLPTWAFDYNSCRVPWRQAMAYAHYGIATSKDIASKMATWAATKYAGQPANFDAEWYLDGTEVNSSANRYQDASFTSPMIAAGITNASNTTNQNWLNNGWAYMKNSGNWLSSPVNVDNDYFPSTLNLMSMILVSGNWWVPSGGASSCTPTTCAAQGKNCGSIPDGCGTTLTCGSCTAPQTCGGGGTANVCGGTCSESAFNGPHDIPGTLQVEDYDNGGAECAYHDYDVGNSGGAYRTDDVDIQVTTDTGGGYNIGYVKVGDWTKYSVTVATTDYYDITFRVAATSAKTGAVHLIDENGTDITGLLDVPNTGAYQTFTNVTKSAVHLTAGSHVFQMLMEQASFNVNYITFATSSSAPTCTGTLNGSGQYCCTNQCNGSCGGTGCSSRPGGAAQCCTGSIATSGVYCSGSSAGPCIMY
jgi:endo-1,4-beta-D-glucanase Y